MKRTVQILAVLALLPLSFTSWGKSKTLSDFIGKVSSSLVTFEYSFSIQSPGKKAKMTGEGQVKAQGDSFFMEGGGLEVWCDGKTRWTVDPLAEEAIIESVDGSAEGFGSNPALMISSVDEAFKEVSFGSSKFQGKTVDASTLTPVVAAKSSSDIAQMKLFFRSGTSELLGASVKLTDGTLSEFSVRGIKFLPPEESKESFRLDEKTLGDSFVVTDLR